MFLIIKHLDPSVTIDELEEFVVPSVNGRFFQKKGTIKALKIIELVTKKGSSVERHGIVRVDSDSIKARLIKSLNGRSINNIKHFVDEYIFRQWSADRRSTDLPSSALMKNRTLNRRMSDRRRSGLKMIEVSQKLFSIQTVQSSIPKAI